MLWFGIGLGLTHGFWAKGDGAVRRIRRQWGGGWADGHPPRRTDPKPWHGSPCRVRAPGRWDRADGPEPVCRLTKGRRCGVPARRQPRVSVRARPWRPGAGRLFDGCGPAPLRSNSGPVTQRRGASRGCGRADPRALVRDARSVRADALRCTPIDPRNVRRISPAFAASRPSVATRPGPGRGPGPRASRAAIPDSDIPPPSSVY